MRSRVYAFLDLEHPPVAWAVMRGVLSSAHYASDQPQDGWISFMHAGMIYHQNNARLFNETIIEIIRISQSFHSTSRLRGMYFFSTKTEAEARINDKNWPCYFIPDNLVELEIRTPSQATFVDANWITFAPLCGNGMLDLEDLDWVGRYWSGQPFNAKPTWELIVEGIAVVRDEHVRRRCFAYMREVFPNAQVPILMARLAGESGSRGGQILPFVLKKNDGRFQLGYVANDADFHDPKVISEIARHPDSGALARLMAASETWHRPDFTPWFKEFCLGTRAISAIANFQSLHHL